MKRIIRIFVIEGVSLYFISQLTSGFSFENGTTGLIFTAIGLTIASLFVKPIINLLLLPLNLLTFGLFRFLTNAITLFLVDLVLNQFSISGFHFIGFSSELFVIPSISFPAGPFAYLAFSFMISFVTTIIYWLIG